MYHSSKSCILQIYDSSPSQFPSINPTCLVVDLSCVTRASVSSSTAKNFDEFADNIINSVFEMSCDCSRIDICTDNYFERSLKTDTRVTRGNGQYFPFKGSTKLPQDIKECFFSNNKNKEEFNDFLAQKFLDYDCKNVELVISIKDEVLHKNKNISTNLDYPILAAFQEEADTKIMAHIVSCCQSGHQYIRVKTVDSGVITLLLAFYGHFQTVPQIEVDFLFGKQRKYFNLKKIISTVSEGMRSGLLFFYAFTGSDFTSSFLIFQKLIGGKYGKNILLSLKHLKN